MARLAQAAWWTVRPAHNRRPATYTCPLCGGFLPALSEHMLLMPEGDASRRRHAHAACVLRARRAGRLPLHEELEQSKPPSSSPTARGLMGTITRLLRRGR